MKKKSCQSKVFIYRNLNRPGRIYSQKCQKTQRVIARSERFVIKDALLVVSEAGRRRVLKERRKNVHAGIRGIPLSRLPVAAKGLRKVRIWYNPYKAGYFVDVKGRPVREAKYVVISPKGDFAFI